jgi:hypothetical protein
LTRYPRFALSLTHLRPDWSSARLSTIAAALSIIKQIKSHANESRFEVRLFNLRFLINAPDVSLAYEIEIGHGASVL